MKNYKRMVIRSVPSNQTNTGNGVLRLWANPISLATPIGPGATPASGMSQTP